MKLFPHVGSNSLNLFVMYNLLPNRILAYEAREEEKRNPIMKINIHEKGDSSTNQHSANVGGPQLLAVMDGSQLTPLKPKRSNTRPITNRIRKIRGQFERQFRRIELAQRNRKIVRNYRNKFWKRKETRRNKVKFRKQMRDLPSLLFRKVTDPFRAGWRWLRGNKEPMILECNLEILKTVQHPSALLSIFAFGASKTELEAAPGFDSNSIPIAVDPCASASIFKESTFFTSWEPVKNIYFSGVGGRIPIMGQGTAHFYILDDMFKVASSPSFFWPSR